MALKLMSVIAGLTLSATLFADPVNITQYDGEGAGTGWNGANEDQEVSTGCIRGQQWDLEAYILDGSMLSIIGGYDFVDGEADPYYTSGSSTRLSRYYSGDLFIDINHNAQYGAGMASLGDYGCKTVNNSFGWDYVLDLDMENLTYEVFQINESSKVKTVFYASYNAEANPWVYESGGTSVTTGTIVYTAGLGDADVGYGIVGGNHNKMTVDLSFLGDGTEFTSHFTMQCGNDNIIGKGEVSVPEAGSVVLLSMGLLLFGTAGMVNGRQRE